MSREFEASIIIAGSDGASAESLKSALESLLAKASKFPPDYRFDWPAASVTAEVYTANPKGKA